MWISDALAQSAPAASGSSLMSFLPMVVILVLFYFMLIRPQQKKQRELQDAISKLQKGDEVTTTGGLLGKVVKTDEQHLWLEIADDVHVMVQRQAVGSVLPKGTLKKP